MFSELVLDTFLLVPRNFLLCWTLVVLYSFSVVAVVVLEFIKRCYYFITNFIFFFSCFLFNLHFLIFINLRRVNYICFILCFFLFFFFWVYFFLFSKHSLSLIFLIKYLHLFYLDFPIINYLILNYSSLHHLFDFDHTPLLIFILFTFHPTFLVTHEKYFISKNFLKQPFLFQWPFLYFS